MMDTFGIILSILSFIFGFAVAVDNAANPSLKKTFIAYLNHPVAKCNQTPTENSYHIAVRSFETVLSSKFATLRFFFRSVLVLLCHLPRLCDVWLEAAWAARQGSGEADDEVLADGADRVWHVPFRPDRRRRAAGSLRVAQVPRAAGG